MKGLALAFLLLLHASFPAPEGKGYSWRPVQAENLAHWVDRADEEGIDLPDGEADGLRAAIDNGDRQQLDARANTAAMRLIRAWHGRCCGPLRPARWHIADPTDEADWRPALQDALAQGRLDLFLRSMRPQHAYYRALAKELARETNPEKRQVLATNLARWRWMPRDLGPRYVLVNAASQEVSLWEQGERRRSWRAIVGKPTSYTPVFSAEVTGVVFNPWWEIPASIAAEGIAAFVRRSPAAARERGYVYANGRYRQMPGDNNALGRMKLVMPNPYSVFLHDTSNRSLFDGENRTLSHGCVRVDQALGFAAALLAVDGWEQADVDALVAKGATVTVDLAEPIPVYVAYFTAEPQADGSIRFHDDIYGRDGLIANRQASAGGACSAG